jgi:hypothetical protein
MATFHVQDPATGGWSIPMNDAAIRQALAAGSIEPTRLVWSGQATEAPIAASSLSAPSEGGVPSWLKALGAFLGILGGTWAIKQALTSTRSTRRDLPRLPRALPAPREDPETVAIRRTAKRHVKDGAEVCADISGWPRPPKINGHIPDVYARYPDGREVVQEFENDRSVFSTHARRQDVAFSDYAGEVEHVEYEQIVVRGGRGGRG